MREILFLEVRQSTVANGFTETSYKKGILWATLWIGKKTILTQNGGQ